MQNAQVWCTTLKIMLIGHFTDVAVWTPQNLHHARFYYNFRRLLLLKIISGMQKKKIGLYLN